MLPQDGESETVDGKLDGFFICIKDQLVMLRFNSQVQMTSQEKLSYNIDTTVYARSAQSINEDDSFLSDPSSTTESCTLTSCPIEMGGRLQAVYRTNLSCEASKKICWKNVPIVKNGTDTPEFAVVVDVEQDIEDLAYIPTDQTKTLVDVITPTASAANGNTESQTVAIYTKETLPNTSDISLKESQVLVVIKDLVLNKEYQIVITFDSTGKFI
jgi:hypothetical protein